VNKLFEWVCGALAAVALFGIMVLTFFDVGGRKFASASITGSLEVTELLMVIVIFAALPLVSIRREHVVFDSFDHVLSPAVRRVQTMLVNLVCSGLLLALAWLMAQPRPSKAASVTMPSSTFNSTVISSPQKGL